MEFASVPIILICCYIIGEIFKFIFKNKQETYKLIPVILAIFGGVIAAIIYYTNPEMIFDAENIWVALMIGFCSGTSSTGSNQIIKQLFLKEDSEDVQ